MTAGKPEPGVGRAAHVDVIDADAVEISTSEQQAAPVPLSWAQRHPRLRWAFIALAVAAVVVLVVTLPVCLTRGCPPRQTTPHEMAKTALRLVVQFKQQGLDALQELPAQLRQFATNQLLDSSQLQVLTLSSEAVLQEAYAALETHPELQLLTRDFAMSISRQIGQPRWSAAAALGDGDACDDPGGQGLLGTCPTRRLQQQASRLPPSLSQADVLDAWRTTRGHDRVVVAVLDTGIDLTHPDLKDALWVNGGEIPGNGVDDDRNGYVDDVHGIDLLGRCANNEYDMFGLCKQCAPSNDVGDVSGHGSHVAGIVAALQDYKDGISGVAPNVRLMPLKVADCTDGTIWASAVFAAFDYALKKGANIVSCSFANVYADGFTPVTAPPFGQSQQNSGYAAALKPLAAAGVLVVAAAGNNRLNLDAYKSLGYANNPCFATSYGNVLCVGATDASGKTASFSNYGATAVHLSGPGSNIKSTYLDGTYAELSGTSMAAPLVSGTAALVLSVIGQMTGNYSGQATNLVSILRQTAQKPVGAAPRVNAQAAVEAALKQFAPADVTFINPTTVTSSQAVSTMVAFTERYYQGTSTNAWQSMAIDSSVRAASLPLSTFKYGSNTTVRFSANINITSPGLHNLRLAGTGLATILVNGQRMPMVRTSTASRATFIATAAGTYGIDLIWPNPAAPVDASIQSPETGVYTRLRATAISTLQQNMSVHSAPDFATTRSGFMVYYNRTSSEPVQSALHTLSMQDAASLAQSLAAKQLNIAASMELQNLLFPQSSGTVGAIGMALGSFAVPAGARQYQFRLTCKRCSLEVNGQLLLDKWESPTLAGGAAKQTACVTLANGTASIVVRFATGRLSDASLVLQQAACGSTSWQILQSPSRHVWSPVEAVTGYVGGVQCDAWLGSHIPQGTAPLYKTRFPRADGWTNPMAADLKLPFNTTLAGLLPGLSGSSQRFSVRCWTFSNTTYDSIHTSAPAGATASLWVGGMQVQGADAQGVAGSNFSGSASGLWRSLAAEWYNVSSSARLWLADKAGALTADQTTMLLPFQITATKDTTIIGASGHRSQAFSFSASPVDVGNLVSYTYSGQILLGRVTVLSKGLNIAPELANYTMSRSPRYVRATGYLMSPVNTSTATAVVRLYVSEPAQQANLIVIGGAHGITLRPGASYTARTAVNASAVGYSYEVAMPKGYVQLEYVAKSAQQSIAATFSAAFIAPVNTPVTSAWWSIPV